MDEWRRRMPAPPHLATAIPHYHGLDFGRTMPLRHPPPTAQVRSNIASSPQSFLPFSHPLAPLPIPVASRGELPLSPTSSSLSGPSQIQAASSETARAQNVEKKRWQTANYRWMFTKRKGNKTSSLYYRTQTLQEHGLQWNIQKNFCYIVCNTNTRRHIRLPPYFCIFTLVCMFSYDVRFFECSLNASQIIRDKILWHHSLWYSITE